MKILVLGGTRFFGIHMVNDLIEKGHEVTLATRGITPDYFEDSYITKYPKGIFSLCWNLI